MNTLELAAEVAKKEKMTVAQAKRVVATVFSTIRKTVSSKKPVQLTGFGTFKSVKRKARNGVKPGTKERIKIPAKTVVKFTAGKSLKADVSAVKAAKATKAIAK